MNELLINLNEIFKFYIWLLIETIKVKYNDIINLILENKVELIILTIGIILGIILYNKDIDKLE